MARVRADDYEAKRQTIVEKAAALIARKGFEAATMMDIAKACGASKSHLYHYFSSKEELLYAIAHEHITAQVELLKGIAEQPLSAEKRFEQFVDIFMQGAARSRNEHLILMNDIKFLPKAQHDEIRRLETVLTGGMESLLHEINPELMAEERFQTPYALLLFGMMIWTFTWYRRDGSIKPHELAQRISTLFVHGFKAMPKTSG
jgi:AcrR family transcriptional regulator